MQRSFIKEWCCKYLALSLGRLLVSARITGKLSFMRSVFEFRNTKEIIHQRLFAVKDIFIMYHHQLLTIVFFIVVVNFLEFAFTFERSCMVFKAINKNHGLLPIIIVTIAAILIKISQMEDCSFIFKKEENSSNSPCPPSSFSRDPFIASWCAYWCGYNKKSFQLSTMESWYIILTNI